VHQMHWTVLCKIQILSLKWDIVSFQNLQDTEQVSITSDFWGWMLIVFATSKMFLLLWRLFRIIPVKCRSLRTTQGVLDFGATFASCFLLRVYNYYFLFSFHRFFLVLFLMNQRWTPHTQASSFWL
jgi:hypothetical protein